MLHQRARVVSMNTVNLHPSQNKSIQFLAIQMTLLLKVILLYGKRRLRGVQDGRVGIVIAHIFTPIYLTEILFLGELKKHLSH